MMRLQQYIYQLTNLGNALSPYAIRACVGSTCGGGRVVTRGNAILFISVAMDID